MKNTVFLLLLPLLLFSSTKNNELVNDDDMMDPIVELYFPPAQNADWEHVQPDSLGWALQELDLLGEWLASKNTRAFILLKEGRIAYESYWGKELQGTNDFDESSEWYWASAGKSLMASMIGKAQELGFLDIEEASSNYLGEGWTSLSQEQEQMIRVKHQLTMTTGLDYTVADQDCTDPDCLKYREDPGTQWYYHNAPYSLLADVLENASDLSLNEFTRQHILDPINMEGFWLPNGYGNLFFSNARHAARFGLLALNNFKWNGQNILTDESYVQAMRNSSQDLNPSYGYLWWLNGKSSIIFPGLPFSFNRGLADTAPSDLVGALGKNGQFIEYVPSLDVVVVRFGDSPDGSPAAINFHEEMWSMLTQIIQ